MAPILAIFLLLTIIVVASKLGGYLSTKIGQPAVFGEIMIGVLLGPTLIDILSWDIFHLHGQPHFAEEFVSVLAEIGVLLLMFVAGLETDLEDLMKVGQPAIWGGIGGLLGPFAFGALTYLLFIQIGMKQSGDLIFTALFIGTILTATSVSISAQTLLELDRLQTRPGLTILGGAVVDDVLGILLLSIVVAFAPAGVGQEGKHVFHDYVKEWISQAGFQGTTETVLVIGSLIFLMIFFFFVFWLLWDWFGEQFLRMADNLPVSEGLIAAGLVLALLYGWAAEFLGAVAFITGSYMVGLLIANTTDLAGDIEEGFHTITYSLFVPIFFVSIGLMSNLRDVFIMQEGMTESAFYIGLAFAMVIILVAIVTKIGGFYVGAVYQGMSKIESFQAGVGMVSRGEVGLIIASIGITSGIITDKVFSEMVLMVLVTTLFTPPALRWAFGFHDPVEDEDDGDADGGENGDGYPLEQSTRRK